MEKHEIVWLVEANNWLWGKWWPALLELSPSQAHKEVGGSFPSVFATTAHLVGAEVIWQGRILGNPKATFPPVPQTMVELQTDWNAVATQRQQWLETAQPSDMIPYNFSGGSFTNRVDEILLHLTSHAHFHRGQLASQFRMLGLQPPSAHLIGFYRLNQ